MRIGLAYNQRPATGHLDRDAASTSAVPALRLPDTPDAFVEWDEPETIAAVADPVGQELCFEQDTGSEITLKCDDAIELLATAG